MADNPQEQTRTNTMPFPYDPDAHEGITSPPFGAETDLAPGFVLNVSLPSPQVEEPPLRYLGSLGRSGAGPRSSPASLSRNPIPSLRRDGSGSLSSLAISGVELHDLHTNNSRETSGNKSSEQQRTPDISSNSNNSNKETPQQRVSFDNPPSPIASDKRGIVNAHSPLHSVVYPTEFPKVPSRQIRRSDPTIPSSPILRAFGYLDRQKDSPKRQAPGGSQSPSKPRSRATSPLGIFQQLSGLHRPRGPPEEPFVPINPFAARSRSKSKHKSSKLCRNCSSKQQQQEQSEPQTSAGSTHSASAIIDGKSIASSNLEYGCIHVFPLSFVSKAADSVQFFMMDTLPRHFYLNFLLHLPALYFSRVARIFEDAEVSKPDIQRMIETGGGGGMGFFDIPSNSEGGHLGFSGRRAESSRGPSMSPGAASGIGISSQVGIAPSSGLVQPQQQPLPYPEDWAPPLVSPALLRFKGSWETFIDSLMREWKTLNLVSVLLLSAIMTLFQVNAAASDPIIRNTAFVSLICALMSLSYGCMYIIRFGTMRSMYRATRWAEEARKSKTSLLWNVWVFLAMPAVWMAWSMIWFIVSILAFVWRTGAVNDPIQSAPLSVQVALIPRVVITAVFVLGLIYFVLIVRTLQTYGSIHGNVGWGTAAADSGSAKPSYDAAERGRVRAGSDGAVLEAERRGRERQRRSDSESGRARERKEVVPEKVAGLGLSNMVRRESLDLRLER